MKQISIQDDDYNFLNDVKADLIKEHHENQTLGDAVKKIIEDWKKMR